jgi:hypothetical protein
MPRQDIWCWQTSMEAEWYKTKYLIVIAIILIYSTSAIGQNNDEKTARQRNKELKKEMKEQEALFQAKLTHLLLEQQRFVLEASTIREDRGPSTTVNPDLNYIAVDSLNGVLQFATGTDFGRNGVGGTTDEGFVQNYQYKLNEKNGTYLVVFFLHAPNRSYDVQISVHRNGKAQATVTSDKFGKISYSGKLVAPSSSRVWQGGTIY